MVFVIHYSALGAREMVEKSLNIGILQGIELIELFFAAGEQ
jgi:hypothetical protein